MGSYGILGVFAAPDVGGDTKTLANKEEEEERTEVSHNPKTSLETLHHFPWGYILYLETGILDGLSTLQAST